MRASFMPANEEEFVERNLSYIKILIIDESGPGVEIRIMNDGTVLSCPLTSGVAHFRSSPLWIEIQN